MEIVTLQFPKFNKNEDKLDKHNFKRGLKLEI